MACSTSAAEVVLSTVSASSPNFCSTCVPQAVLGRKGVGRASDPGSLERKRMDGNDQALDAFRGQAVPIH